jgi:hypothetical protein
MSNQDLILAGVGFVVSVLFTWVPVLGTWYYGIASKWRGLTMIGILLVVVGAIFGLSCSGLFSWVACTTASLGALVRAALIAIVTNQVTYQVTPDTKFNKAA